MKLVVMQKGTDGFSIVAAIEIWNEFILCVNVLPLYYDDSYVYYVSYNIQF